MLKSSGARCVLRPGAVCALRWLALALSALAACALALPSHAAAWTDASVRSVKATVTLAANGDAHVAMRVTVRVHGGWLEGLELAGLDPALVLAADAPIILTGEDGAVYTPSVTVRAESDESTRVQLGFERQGAPRRGTYEVALAYSTSLAHRATVPNSDGETVRVRWTLPPWETGLDGVELTLDLPGAARPAEDSADDADTHAAQLSVVNVGERTQLTWRRPHLPRTTVWTIAADVPAASLAPALRRVRVESSSVARRAPAAPVWPVPLALGLLLLGLGALTAWARSAAFGRAGLATSGLVAMPRPLRVAVLVSLLVGAPLAAAVHPALAVVPLALILALLLVRAGAAIDVSDTAPLERRPAARAELRAASRAVLRARLATLDALLDGTTPPGALVAISLVAAALRAHSMLAANPAAPLLVLGAALLCVPLFAQTHRSRRRSPAEALHELRQIASRVRLAEDVPAVFALSVSADASGPLSAHVEITPAVAPGGLRALEIVLAERACGSTVATEPALRITTRDGSDADRALDTVLVDGGSARAHDHTTRLAPLDALEDVLRALDAAACAAARLLDDEEAAPARRVRASAPQSDELRAQSA